MRRPTSMLASASAAALAALAVTVAAPAIGDDGPSEIGDLAACLHAHGLPDAPVGAALKPWLGERLDRGDAAARRAIDACAPPKVDVTDLRACLVEHGARFEGEDPVAIKRWVAEHADDPAAKDAMQACGIGAPPPGDCKPAEPKDRPRDEAKPAAPPRVRT